MSDTKTLIPDFIFKVDGSRISIEQRACIKEITITEKLGTPSSFIIKMSDPDLELSNSDDFFIGNEVKIEMGYKDDITQLIHGEITGISIQFKSNSGTNLIIKGHDHLHRLTRAKKILSFTEMTDTDIIEQIVNDAGLSSDVEIFEDEHLFTAQNNQTDLQYILQMAERHDCDVWMENKKLYFKKQEKNAGEDVVLEWKKTLLEFYPVLETNRLITEVEVRGWCIDDGEAVTGSAVIDDIECTGAELVKDKFGDQKTIIIDNLIQDSDQAEQVALDYLTKQSRDYIEAHGACEGNKDISAGTVLKINEVGKKLSQKYQVISVKHVLNIDRGFTTYFHVMSFVASAGSSQSTGDQGEKQVFAEQKKRSKSALSQNIIDSKKDNKDSTTKLQSQTSSSITDQEIKPKFINLQWMKNNSPISKVQVGEKIEITSDVINMNDGETAIVKIYEKDYDGNNDFISEKKVTIINSKIKLEWVTEFVEDTDDINSDKELKEKGFTYPEFIFTIEKDDIKSDESPVLEYNDCVEIKVINHRTGKPFKNANYYLVKSSGKIKKGQLDENGYAKEENIPPGKYSIVIFDKDKFYKIK